MMSFIHFPAMLPCGVSAPLTVQMNTFLYVTLPLRFPFSFFFHKSLWKVCFSTTATVHIRPRDLMKTWKLLQIITGISNPKMYKMSNYSPLCLLKPYDVSLELFTAECPSCSHLSKISNELFFFFFKPGTNSNLSYGSKSIRI